MPRFSGARKVPPQIQRMRADDLLASVFPAQVGCQENLAGPIEVPDHPLVRQTIDDCLYEANDIEGLIRVLERVESGEVRLHAIDTLEPSPMAHEILTGKPYTYLDDAPLEERRTRAVTLRRALPESARELGALDMDAIDRVREEAWPQPRDTEETHDALLSLVVVPDDIVRPWQEWIDALYESGRAGTLVVTPPSSVSDAPETEPVVVQSEILLHFAAENLRLVQALYPDGRIDLPRLPPDDALVRIEDRDEARTKLLRGWTEADGPVSPAILGERLGLRAEDIERGLRMLEANGFVLRGRFTPGVVGDEYCDRRLLSRIHRYTLDRLRREIDPVSAQDYMRFLLRWQHLTPDTKLAGKQGVRQVIARLQGYETAAGSWERELVAARMHDYRATWLDELCLAGEIAWARLTPRKVTGTGATTSRVMPVSLTLRPDLPSLLAGVRGLEEPPAAKTGAAAEIQDLLKQRGALFFDEIVNTTRRLRSDVERGLRELVASGIVTADGFQGLRQLLGKSAHSGRAARTRGASVYSAGGVFTGSGPAGRWALVYAPLTGDSDRDDLAEAVARTLLQRYGVVFRDLYPRESFTVPWRDILKALRRLEARGQVRGGRFVSGFNGEQYALPDAVDSIRWVRRHEKTNERVTVSALDPVNLVGVVIPGAKVASQPGKEVIYIDGLPVEGPPNGGMKTPVPSKLMPKLAGTKAG